jgi:solute carrier family 25 (mitochondrial citrate transporter), member 1
MPFDNIKTRMQSMGGGYTGMLDCAIKTLHNDGFAALWRGTTPRLVRLTVSKSVMQRHETVAPNIACDSYQAE